MSNELEKKYGLPTAICLIVGTVVDAGFEETGVAKYALLKSAADISALEQVFILTEYTTE